MTAEPDEATWLVVNLKSEDEQIAQIVEVLRQLEIPARVVDHAERAERRRVTLRVPADRVVAAVLALEQHGFTRLRAYGGEAPAGS